MRSGLQVSDDLPDLIFAEMYTPSGHDRALRMVGFDRFPDLNSPVEVSRVDCEIVWVGEIRRWWVKKSCTLGAAFARLAVAGRTLVHEQVMSGFQLHSIIHQEIWHLSRRVINVVLSATEEHQQ
jgi:hypothetical protein